MQRWEKLLEEQTQQHFISKCFMVEWHVRACFEFVKWRLKNSLSFRKHSLGWDKNRELFGHNGNNYVCSIPGAANCLANTILMVKHVVGSAVLRRCISRAGTWRLLRIEGRMNVAKYRKVLNMKPCSKVHRTWDWGDSLTFHITMT